MAQVISRWALTAKTRVRVGVSPCGICGGKGGTGTGFFSEFFDFALLVSCHHYSLPICHRPIRCEIVLTKQHIVIPSVLS
jgi:hypothetical protein